MVSAGIARQGLVNPGCAVTYPHVVVPAARGQTALPMGLEVGRVDGGILVVPIDDCRSALHGDISSSSPPLAMTSMCCLRALLVPGSRADLRAVQTTQGRRARMETAMRARSRLGVDGSGELTKDGQERWAEFVIQERRASTGTVSDGGVAVQELKQVSNSSMHPPLQSRWGRRVWSRSRGGHCEEHCAEEALQLRAALTRCYSEMVTTGQASRRAIRTA